jgi:hypothetical protein
MVHALVGARFDTLELALTTLSAIVMQHVTDVTSNPHQVRLPIPPEKVMPSPVDPLIIVEAKETLPPYPVGDIATFLPDEYDDLPSLFRGIEPSMAILREGLQVTYSLYGITYFSVPLEEEVEFHIQGDPNKKYYLYMDVDEEGTFVDLGYTEYRPTATWNKRPAVGGDWFNISSNKFYDPNGEVKLRAYLGTCTMNGTGEIETIKAIPFGREIRLPILFPSNAIMGTHLDLDNPFLFDVDVKVEVCYNGYWGRSEWNDQIGILGGMLPTDRSKIRIQTGSQGFMTNGPSTGNRFGHLNTLTTIPRVRAIITRTF